MTMFLAALLGSGLACLLIVRYSHLHIRLTGDHVGNQPQKFHTTVVPRIGGVGIMVGLLFAGALSYLLEFGTAGFFWMILAVLIPAFLGGVAEDLTRRVGPSVRLLLTVIAAALAFKWLGAQLYRSDVSWLDALLAYGPVSFAATLFAVAGVAHAMNIIDGYNGLSSGVGIMSLLAMGIVSRTVHDPQLTAVCFATAGAYGGFLLFNYPVARIFLGDGGAYLLGTVLAIVAALLVARHVSVSPWFPLALLIYPIWETLFSALRRLFLHRTHIGQPDARHLHSLIYRRVLRVVYPGNDVAAQDIRNAATTAPLWGVQLILVFYAILHYQSTAALVAEAFLFIGGYSAAYFWLNRLKRPVPTRLQRYLARRARRRRRAQSL